MIFCMHFGEEEKLSEVGLEKWRDGRRNWGQQGGGCDDSGEGVMCSFKGHELCAKKREYRRLSVMPAERRRGWSGGGSQGGTKEGRRFGNVKRKKGEVNAVLKVVVCRVMSNWSSLVQGMRGGTGWVGVGDDGVCGHQRGGKCG